MKNNFEKPDFFISGKIGSGKDTVADYLKAYFGYYKFRIADTIKRIITERKNVSFEELEELKRNNPEIRNEHTDTGDWLGKGSNINRCNLLVNRKSLDWQNLDVSKPFVVCDARSKEEIEVFLQNDNIGIFLSRLTGEYSKSTHWTEQNLFTNGVLSELIDEYPGQIIVVLNGGEYKLEDFQNRENLLALIQFETENISGEELLEKIDVVLTQLIEKEKEE